VTGGELKATASSDSQSKTNGAKATPPEPERTQDRSRFVERFIHPGLLHSQSDLARMKDKVSKGEQPWASGFDQLKLHRQSQSDWRVRGPFASVVRDPRRSQHLDELVADGNAAYQNALMWCVTGNEAHARKSVEILNAWSSTLREITGNFIPRPRPVETGLRDGMESLREPPGPEGAFHQAGRRENPARGRRLAGGSSRVWHAIVHAAVNLKPSHFGGASSGSPIINGRRVTALRNPRFQLLFAGSLT
jgi:hypothetical protein